MDEIEDDLTEEENIKPKSAGTDISASQEKTLLKLRRLAEDGDVKGFTLTIKHLAYQNIGNYDYSNR
jgi:hypothetical protein